MKTQIHSAQSSLNHYMPDENDGVVVTDDLSC